MKKNYFFTLFVLLGISFSSISYGQLATIDYTGDEIIFTIPGGVGSIQLEVKGAKGTDNGGVGGSGSIMIGTFAVVPGEELTIYAGGNPAGLNAGGDGSYVAREDGTLMIAAGGGGGGRDTDGGDAVITEDGTAPPIHIGSPGGVGGEGGEAGEREWGTGGGGGWFSAGEDGEGSPGGAIHCRASVGTTFAGGAGGGYSGGGGVRMFSGDGTGGGGGGGSYNAGEDQDNTPGANAGPGQVIITALCFPLLTTVTDYDPCINEYITLTAESETGGEISWEDGVEDGVPFIPGAPGLYSYTVNSTGPEDCSVVIEINVRPFPTVIANAAPTELCEGESMILYGGGAETYEWSPGDIADRDVIYPAAGTHTYIATGTDEFGCVADDEVTVVVHPEPILVITADKTVVCQGDEVTLTASGGVEYDWDSPVENGIPFAIDAVGSFTYEVEMEDVNGCEVEGEITITVGAPIEITYTVTAEVLGDDGAIEIDVTGGTVPYTFDWDNDGTGDFDDPEDLTGIAGGDYVVVVKDAGTCSGTESMTIETQLGLELLNGLEVNVFPNPTSDILNVNLLGEFTYTLYSISGQEILLGQDFDQTFISMNDFEKGQYILKIQQGVNIVEIPVIKQ
ncbi:T9SS type A sorting domain-containing protein [Crocinitomix catalasitica]|uniref:T9SS type A sorting domain-containing protein n=1 Tax=Crocinitomix catalasitica TaxID=184607 RepID=UPI000486D738|nr:T9SS type A sorting domain-containing protein [Crocinitomix catalasitica]